MTAILVLGGGTAGTIMANRLRRTYSREIDSGLTTVTVVDQDPQYIDFYGLAAGGQIIFT